VADRQTALLRGVNAGIAKRVAMADLRALVEALGYGEVRTLANSGNVVYTAPGVRPAAAAARIEEALAARLLGDEVTSRNWTTMSKLAALVRESRNDAGRQE
jgi:uncharacterized protein (DUF1697 family)